VTVLADVIETALTGRRLLAHPFYQRWTAGTLSIEELREYAGQYGSIEHAQPRWLTGIAERLETGAARDAVTRVLDDETDDGASHADLFDRFATAIGATPNSAPTAATRRLVDTLDRLVAKSPATGLGGLLAYEVQSSEVSREKAAGLRRHFGIDGDGTAFWDTHADLDERHCAWLSEAVERSGADAGAVAPAVREAADAWWAFLDEREGSRPA